MHTRLLATLALLLFVPPSSADTGGGDAPDVQGDALAVHDSIIEGTLDTGRDDDWYRIPAGLNTVVRVTFLERSDPGIHIGLTTSQGWVRDATWSPGHDAPTIEAVARETSMWLVVQPLAGQNPLPWYYRLAIELLPAPDLAITEWSMERTSPGDPLSPYQVKATVRNEGDGDGSAASMYAIAEYTSPGRRSLLDETVNIPAGTQRTFEFAWDMGGQVGSASIQFCAADALDPWTDNQCTRDRGFFGHSAYGFGVDPLNTWLSAPGAPAAAGTHHGESGTGGQGWASALVTGAGWWASRNEDGLQARAGAAALFTRVGVEATGSVDDPASTRVRVYSGQTLPVLGLVITEADAGPGGATANALVYAGLVAAQAHADTTSEQPLLACVQIVWVRDCTP